MAASAEPGMENEEGSRLTGNALLSVHLHCHSEGAMRAEKSRTSAQEKQNITIKVSHGMLGGAKVRSKDGIIGMSQAQDLRVREFLIRAEQEGADCVLTS